MSILRHAARTLLATVVVVEGLDAVRDPYAHVEGGGRILQGAARRGGQVPDQDPALLVRANGALQVGAGLAVITDTATRPAAFALAASMVPATLGDEPFWEAEGKERSARMRSFLTRLGLIGGLLIVAMDTEGKPGVAWKTAWAAKRAGELAEHQREIMELKAQLAQERARHAAAETRGRIQGTARQARRDAKLASRAGRSASRAVSKAGRTAKKTVKALSPV